MCQAFDGERASMLRAEKALRKKGYDSMLKGVASEDNPERDHDIESYSDKVQWWRGWDMAASGRELW